MRSFSRSSMIRAFQLRLLNQIFSCQLSVSSLSCSTLSTRSMKRGKSSMFRQRSYAVSTGTATSVQRWIGKRRV